MTLLDFIQANLMPSLRKGSGPMFCECQACKPFQPERERFKCCCGESESVHRTDGPCYKIVEPPLKDACGCHRSNSGELTGMCQVFGRCKCECHEPPSTAGCEHHVQGIEYQVNMPDGIKCGYCKQLIKKPETTKCQHRHGLTCGPECIPIKCDVAAESEAGRPMPDAVQEKIRSTTNDIWNNLGRYSHNNIDDKLRELVQLARGERR